MVNSLVPLYNRRQIRLSLLGIVLQYRAGMNIIAIFIQSLQVKVRRSNHLVRPAWTLNHTDQPEGSHG